MMWGLANSYPDRIEINKNLKYYKDLRNNIIKHELKHIEGNDLIQEFDYNIWKIFPSLSYFILTHPSTWIDFLPIQIRKSKIIIDINMIKLYLIIIVLIIIILIMLKI